MEGPQDPEIAKQNQTDKNMQLFIYSYINLENGSQWTIVQISGKDHPLNWLQNSNKYFL